MAFTKFTNGVHRGWMAKIFVLFFALWFIFAFRLTLFLVGRDFLYLTRPIWDKKPEVPEHLIAHFHGENIPPDRLCSLHGWKLRGDEDVKPKVIDAFIFSVELDILEIRMKELWEVVDIFVIVEADKTFTGKKKRLFFSDNKDRFVWASEKLVHFVCRDLFESPQKDFENEARLRGYMSSYVRSLNPKTGDLIIVSDVDELPSAETVRLLKSCQGYPSELHLELENFIYSFEFRLQTKKWEPHVTIYDPSNFWYHHGRHGSNYRLADAGWHCSFCFKYISDFVFKMTSYSHSDRVTKSNLLEAEEIQWKICEGFDIFDMLPEAYTFKDLIFQMGKVERTFATRGIPKYVAKNPDKYPFLLPNGCIREQGMNQTSSNH